MKRDKLLSCLIAAGLALCISFGGVACMVTGLSLDAVELSGILMFCVPVSLVAAVCFSFRHGWWVPAGVGTLALGYLWRTGVLERSVEALLHRISGIYDCGYGWGVIAWTGENPLLESPEAALCLIAAVTSVLTVWTVCYRRRAIAAVAVGFLPLVSCLVMTDTVPDGWCLFLLLAGQVPLLLTNTVRRRSAPDGNKLTALLLVPSILLTALLFWAVPREGYQNQNLSAQERILTWLQKLPFIQLGESGGIQIVSPVSPNAVDLTAVGPQVQTKTPVMDVTAPLNGVLYLRGQVLDVYDGESWDVSEYASGKDSGWTDDGFVLGEVTVRTRSIHSQRYLPYSPPVTVQWDSELADGKLENLWSAKEYSFPMVLADNTGPLSLKVLQVRQCRSLPWEIRDQALEHLERLPVDVSAATLEQTVEAIGEYVRSSAEYDLNTPAMPRGESDFAMWFLDASDTGYCVHFATAAVVLLRAAGVPARYATGYVCNATAEETVTVTENLAHAWVEYFDPSGGWKILDPTPSTGREDPREPSDTEPTTRPVEPADTTAPSTGPEVTRPAGPDMTRPSLPEDPEPGQTSGEKPDLSWLRTVGKAALWTAAVCFVLLGQYLLRLELRRKRMRTGPVNTRALAKWQEVLRLHRILKTHPPEELRQLAEKAKFSQHTLTAEERRQFDRHLTLLGGELQKRSFPRRMLIRLVWAVK